LLERSKPKGGTRDSTETHGGQGAATPVSADTRAPVESLECLHSIASYVLLFVSAYIGLTEGE